MSEATFAAVDLGASSGRVMAGRVGSGVLELDEVRRFPNRPVRVNGPCTGTSWVFTGTCWTGCGTRSAGLASVGIDSWAVDYGLLDAGGTLLGDPVHYRDARTDGVMDRVRAELGDDLLYGASGLQFLPFNTIYQLVADDLSRASTMLLVPDLLAYWLTGEVGAGAPTRPQPASWTCATAPGPATSSPALASPRRSSRNSASPAR